MPLLVGRTDPLLLPCLERTQPLRFGGALPPGLPPYVRAASAIRRWQGQRIVVQDDVLAIARLDAQGAATALALPAGQDGARVFDAGHSNKAAKSDLEAATALPDGRLLLFGSGASAAREVIYVLTPGAPTRRIDAAPLYAALRGEQVFAATPLNIEGALVKGDRLLLLQRGNEPRSGRNSIAELPLAEVLDWLDAVGPAPALARLRQFDLGAVAGVALGFTDACLLPDGRLALLACAENSASVLTDGPVLACRFGILDGDELRLADVRDAAGSAALLKLEGIEWAGAASFDVVADADDPAAAALLGLLRVTGM